MTSVITFPFPRNSEDAAANRRERRFYALAERRVAALVRQPKHALQHPGQALKRELRAMGDELRAIGDAYCLDAEVVAVLKTDVAAEVANDVVDKLLATVPMEPPPVPDDPPPVIRLADHRQEIRESRAYEATTGPPRPKTATAPECKSEADRFLNSSVQQADLIPSEKNNQTEFFGAPPCARNAGENLAARQSGGRPCAAA
jgi:hypothetical protein